MRLRFQSQAGFLNIWDAPVDWLPAGTTTNTQQLHIGVNIAVRCRS
ncbi:MAG: hypothetical protein KME28_05090 [Pelatocladus maniniholoensis HA4357-MV3]|uniref:Uncharacterized protein n=1 Tax=Pelatocladus maniniholoensis HA4357-MV3 TaxID=1117104 RepID=A0A9E3LS40_9NOST|nr:hypothetical protein [Pelatocladus maniniholoensis HA4357-MV3]